MYGIPIPPYLFILAFIFKESESYNSSVLPLTASWLSDLSLRYMTPQIHASLL